MGKIIIEHLGAMGQMQTVICTSLESLKRKMGSGRETKTPFIEIMAMSFQIGLKLSTLKPKHCP